MSFGRDLNLTMKITRTLCWLSSKFFLASLFAASLASAASEKAQFSSMNGQWTSRATNATDSFNISSASQSVTVKLTETWTIARFDGTFSVDVSAAEVTGERSGSRFRVDSGPVKVIFRLQGTFAAASGTHRVNYYLGAAGTPQKSVDATLTNWCSSSRSYSGTNVSIDHSVECSFSSFDFYSNDSSKLAGNSAFRIVFDSSAVIEGWVDFAWQLPSDNNVSISSIEVVQAVQTEGNGVPLIAGKDTVVRVFVKASDKAQPGVNARLYLRTGGVAPAGPRDPMNGPITAPLTGTQGKPDRNNPDHSLNFQIPTDWIAKPGPFQVEAELVFPPDHKDKYPDDNRMTSDLRDANGRSIGTLELLDRRSPLKVRYTNYCVLAPDIAGKITFKCPSLKSAGWDFLTRTMYPIASSKLTYDFLEVDDAILTESDLTNDRIIKKVRRQFEFLSSHGGAVDQLIAWLPDLSDIPMAQQKDKEVPLGSSDPVWPPEWNGSGRVAFGQDTSSKDPLDPSFTMAHEMAHNFDQRHTSQPDMCADDPRVFDPKSRWPHEGKSNIQDPGFDTRVPLFVPSSKMDVMTYCSPPANDIWISAWTYAGILRNGFFLSDEGVATGGLGAATGLGMLVSGRVSRNGTSATLDPIYRIENLATDSKPTGGYCVAAMRNATVTAKHCFDLSFVNFETGKPMESQSFVARLPWVVGSTGVVLTNTGRELASIAASTNPPQVRITGPSAGDSWDGGTRRITWTASDPDGDALNYVLLYSADDGATWLLLRDGGTEPFFELNPARIKGGSRVRFRVLATDGFHTSVAETGPMTVVQRPSIVVTPTPIVARQSMVEQGRLATFQIGNTGTGPLTVSGLASNNPAFRFDGQPLPFTVPAGQTRDVAVQFTAPATGTTSGTVRITSNDASRAELSVPIEGTGISAPLPDAELDVTSVDFGSLAVGASATRVITLRNYGPGVLAVQSITSSNPAFNASGILAGQTLGNESVRITLVFAPTAAGQASGTLSISTNDPRRPALQVRLTGSATGGGGQVRPVINVGGVVDAAQFGGTVTQGSIASIFGADLAAGVMPAATVPLPVTLSGVQVQVAGRAAPLYFVAPGQINFQVPFETPLGLASVVVVRNGVASAAQTVRVAAYAPAIFANALTGDPIVVRHNENLITAANPARAGDVLILYMTGAGDVSNPPPSGAVAAASPLSSTRILAQVTVGGVPATVLWSGLAPGWIGLLQVNIQLPASLPTGNRLPLVVRFGEAASTAVQLPVRGGT